MWEAQSPAATVPFRITLATVAARSAPPTLAETPWCSLPLLQCGRRSPLRRLSRSGSPSLPSRRGAPLPHWGNSPVFTPSSSMWEAQSPAATVPFRFTLVTVAARSAPPTFGETLWCSLPLLQCGRRAPLRRLSRSGSPSLPSRRGAPLPHWGNSPVFTPSSSMWEAQSPAATVPFRFTLVTVAARSAPPTLGKLPGVHSLFFNVGGALRRGDCPVQVHPRYRRGAERPSHIGGNSPVFTPSSMWEARSAAATVPFRFTLVTVAARSAPPTLAETPQRSLPLLQCGRRSPLRRLFIPWHPPKPAATVPRTDTANLSAQCLYTAHAQMTMATHRVSPPIPFAPDYSQCKTAQTETV